MTPFFPPFMWVKPRRFKRMYRHAQHWRGDESGLSGAIWLIGLGVLFFTGWWWPGILLVGGVAMVVGAFTREWQPSREAEADEVETEAPSSPSRPPEPINIAPVIPQQPIVPAPVAPTLNWLPAHCPNCGGPLSPKSTRAITATTAECAWCGSHLTKEH